MFHKHPHNGVLKAENGKNAPYRISIKNKSRRISIRIDTKKREAVLVCPHARTIPEALKFASERIDWIVHKIEDLPQSIDLTRGSFAPFLGENYLIAQGQGRSVSIIDDAETPALAVPGPEEKVPAKVIGFLKAQARLHISELVAKHASTLDVHPAGIALKDTRTRWGSCSSKGNLNFSWRLVCAPYYVLDYVTAHECSHLLEMNHSARFWAHVQRCIPDDRPARQWLNTYGRELHAVGS